MKLPKFLSWLGPAPGPGEKGALSGSWTTLGNISLVPSLGLNRDATYRDIYLTNPWVYAAVNKKAGSVGRLPVHVYERDDKGRKRRAVGNDLERLFTQPKSGISRNAFVGGTVRDRLIYGNALWEIKRQGAGTPTGLNRIRWCDVVKPIEDSDGNVLGYQLKKRDTFGRPRMLLAADAVHFGLGTDEGACGISPLQSCSATLKLHDALTRHLIAYFANSMRPSGHIKVEKLTEKIAGEIREAIQELYSSPENAGHVLVTSGEWQGVTDTLEHAQIIELLKQSAVEVAAAYEIPPPVIGILDHAIKSNVKELREQYGRDSIGPLASDFEQDVMAQLIAPVRAWDGFFVEFQLAELLRPDMEARAMVYQRLASIFSIDEIRGFENAEPFDLPGVTDIPWAQSGSMPLTTAAKGRDNRPPADSLER